MKEEMKVKILTRDPELLEDYDFNDGVIVKIDGETEFAVFDGEPEDNYLSRNFNSCYQIGDLIKKVHNAGINGIDISIEEGFMNDWDREKIENEVLKQMVDHFPTLYREDVCLDDNLTNDLGADSLDYVEIAMLIEDRFDIEVDDEDLESFKTIRDIVDYVDASV